ncbi:MAG TPA: hypothetical protein H9875_02900 [Candidatus Levilactobacillus faecigallinarum]|uniref:Uncharacterized protein n=1 Tax=Candidatus Levilactobacillus faecigallinarum TaxID=2838638 RepID=A0A9D1QQJ7_9LACO|nr:hypothetical protein [Candidatus Levilactobacillus faecigallinarum]
MLLKNVVPGTLIAVIGVAFLIFVLAKLLPKTKADHDAHVLAWIYFAVSLGIIGMGSWIFVA